MEEKIDLYFDNRAEKKAILKAWDGYVEARPDESKRFYGASPQFKDDGEFLPLQAADFWAWWVRKSHTESPEKIRAPHWGRFGFRSTRPFLSVHIQATLDNIITTYKSALRIATEGRGTIYDVRVGYGEGEPAGGAQR